MDRDGLANGTRPRSRVVVQHLRAGSESRRVETYLPLRALGVLFFI